MNLGELEFTTDDFENKGSRSSARMAEVANAKLRERLANAPPVWGDATGRKWTVDPRGPQDGERFMGRVVCIDGIK